MSAVAEFANAELTGVTPGLITEQKNEVPVLAAQQANITCPAVVQQWQHATFVFATAYGEH